MNDRERVKDDNKTESLNENESQSTAANDETKAARVSSDGTLRPAPASAEDKSFISDASGTAGVDEIETLGHDSLVQGSAQASCQDIGDDMFNVVAEFATTITRTKTRLGNETTLATNAPTSGPSATSYQFSTSSPGASHVYPSNYDVNAEVSADFVYDAPLIVHTGVTPTERDDSLIVDADESQHPVLLGTVVVTHSSNPSNSLQENPVLVATPVNGVYVKRRPLVYTIIGIFLALCLIGLAVGLSAKGNDESSAAMPLGSTTEPTTISRLARILPDYTKEILLSELSADRFQESEWFQASVWTKVSFLPSSAQGKAWKWLFSDPKRESRSLEEASLRFALTTLYYATDGPNWINNTNWLSEKDACEWYHCQPSTCILFEGSIYKSAAETCRAIGFKMLFLSSNNLVGTIPAELAMVANLQYLRLSTNKLYGTIHNDIWLSWQHLEALQLYGNMLTGILPSAIGLMKNLEVLGIESNQFRGNLPTEMGEMVGLFMFMGQNNLLTGRLPTQLGRMSSVVIFNLANNELTGQIPPELFKMTELTTLELALNRLSGTIPSNIGSCRLLQTFQLGFNMLESSIPSEIGRLTNLKTLYLNNNTLEGLLPSNLGSLTGLYSLDVSGNLGVSGTVPAALSQLSRLMSLQVFDTSLSGSVPASVCRAFSMQRANDGIVIDCNLVRCDCNCTCI
ncbi:hypothetical protein MPSEU_000226600 [Mayamaea pseudoterrestris]|nr:hypothetical protein MPSEU_000226600 [Mayamaea pseudoterrestris]